MVIGLVIVIGVALFFISKKVTAAKDAIANAITKKQKAQAKKEARNWRIFFWLAFVVGCIIVAVAIYSGYEDNKVHHGEVPSRL